MMTRAEACSTLGISTDYTLEQLKQAHRKAVRTWHPDMSGDPRTHTNFVAVQSAYEFLKCCGASRSKSREEPKPPPPPPPPPKPARIVIKTVKRRNGQCPIFSFEYFTYPVGSEPQLFRRWETLKLKAMA